MTIRSTSICDNEDIDNNHSDDISYPRISLGQVSRWIKHKLSSKVVEDVVQCIQEDSYIKRGSYECVKNNLYKRIIKKAISCSLPNRG